MRAFSTKAVPVSPGITHCSTVSCRCAPARSRGLSSEGVVPPSTGASPACISRSPRAREYAVAAKASLVTAALATVAVATPRWLARRPLLPASSTAPPARWAAIPARLTGVQRAQPALATRRRWSGWSTTAAAPLSPTAPISEPPKPGRQAEVMQRAGQGDVLSHASHLLCVVVGLVGACWRGRRAGSVRRRARSSPKDPPRELLRPWGCCPAGAYGTRCSCLMLAPGADRGHGMDGRHPGHHLSGPCPRFADQRPPGSLTPAWQVWEVILNRWSWPSQMPCITEPVSTLVDAAKPLLSGRS